METLLRKYLWAIDLAVVAICSIFSARALATILEAKLAAIAPTAKVAPRVLTASSQTVYSKQIEDILKRNVFCSTCPPILPEAKGPEAVPVDPQPVRTSLPLKLLAQGQSEVRFPLPLELPK